MKKSLFALLFPMLFTTNPKAQTVKEPVNNIPSPKLPKETLSKHDSVSNFVVEDPIFQKAEIEAEFPGGAKAWQKYIGANLNANLNSEIRVPKRTYVVIVRFIVEKDGTVSNLAAETRHGYGMEEEAMRVIRIGPKWIPAMQNGNIVKAYRRQPVTFIFK